MASETIAVTTALLSALFATSLSVSAAANDPEIASIEAQHNADEHPEAAMYNAERDAKADVAAALGRAKLRGVNTIIVMGANWCHDSRGLAGHLRSERFKPLIAENFELVFVDIDTPQIGQGRNLDIAQGFGVSDIDGTPNVLVISPAGKLINTPEDARSWRNADSRDADDIYSYFAGF